jgi:DUF1365 family protein
MPSVTDMSAALDGAAGALFSGSVMHARMKPVAHRFTYKVFNLLVDIDRLDELAAKNRLFSRNRFNLLSIHDSDHGLRDGSSLRQSVDTALAEAGLDLSGGRTLLLCYPRILGYVFNPLSVYYCHDKHGQLRALIYEVRNTFGEMHCYVAPIETGERRASGIRQERDKLFYVSPFIDMPMRYLFRLTVPEEQLNVRILETDADGPLLAATFSGQRQPLNDRTMLAACARIPFLTLKVIASIHFEAFRLWFKGAPFFRRTPQTGKNITVSDPSGPAPAIHNSKSSVTLPDLQSREIPTS